MGNPNTDGNYVGTQFSPLDSQLAPLGNYGGPTPAMPSLPGSPVIDHARPTPYDWSFDQRKLPRYVGNGLADDIGAAEYEASPVVTTTADNGVGSLRYAITYATNGATITFSNNLSGQIIYLTSGPLLVDQSLTIDGSGLPGGITIDGYNSSRILA